MSKLGRSKIPRINESQREILARYYESWIPNSTIDLKFRFVKILCLDVKNHKLKWLLLHKYINKRRMNYSILSESLVNLIDKELFPIRVFHSVAEWLSPNELDHASTSNWLINSGIFPIENDDALDISIETAKLVYTKLNGTKHLVFSGNKSIHVWWMNFNWQEYVEVHEDEVYSKSSNREKYDRKARRISFHKLQSKITNTLDYRSAVDTRRVVPIINTINAFTGRIVTKLNYDELIKLSDKDILILSNLRNWND